jgi:3-isopropylmalate/(R)-2-methylmalate dehydratase small subunit
MKRFERLRSVAVPLDMVNVDIERIIPARFLTRKRESGLGVALFHDIRFDEAGEVRPDVTLNQPAYAGARILVADENFGCGSSRE